MPSKDLNNSLELLREATLAVNQYPEQMYRAAKAHRLRGNFRKFTEEFWSVAEPAAPFIPNWHVDAVCEHLAAVAKGQIHRLVINVPPGTAKSLLAAVLWPAWVWTWNPAYRALFASYAASLATRDSIRCRSVIESDRYRALFVHDPLRGEVERWSLKADQNTTTHFENSASGFRMALGVGGKATGYRGNCVLVDDAINVTDAPSKAVRDSTRDWWFTTMSSRVNDLARDSFVIIGQRVHEEDLSGLALERGGYEHLCLPSEYDPKRTCKTSLGDPDKRRESGELLFPKLFPKEVLDQARIDLGTDGYAGQHDQLPTPPGGGLFKRQWWKFWQWDDSPPSSVQRPKGCSERQTRILQRVGFKWDSCVMSVDCTFKDADHAKSGKPDWVVLLVVGCSGADRFVLYRWRAQAGLKATCDAIREASRLFPGAFRKLVEDKANGSAVIETLEHEIQGIVPVDPEGGKEARANACAPQVEAGNVYLPSGASWLEEFVGECASFPKGKNDDQVDALTQALIDRMQGRGNRLKMLVSG
jgi:predicted phage terminase large subunit-like protein